MASFLFHFNRDFLRLDTWLERHVILVTQDQLQGVLARGQGNGGFGLRLAEVQHLRPIRQRHAFFRHQAGWQWHVGHRLLVHIHQQVVMAGMRGVVAGGLECHALDAELDGEGLVDRGAIGGETMKTLASLGGSWLFNASAALASTDAPISRPATAARENRLFIHFSCDSLVGPRLRSNGGGNSP